MKKGKLLKGLMRVGTPGILVTAYFFLKSRAQVSTRAEVDMSPNITLGRNCVVGSFTKIKASEGPLVIGDRGGVANGCFISAGAKGIYIGDNFICGPNVNIVGQAYVYREKNKHLEDQGVVSRGIRIGSNVWIGSGSTITDGAVVGDNTIIVAGSLVNRRYPNDVILQGSPAKIILRR